MAGETSRPRPRHRDQPSRARRAGLCRPGAEGAFRSPLSSTRSQPLLGPAHRRRHRAERRAMVVFLQAWRAARRTSASSAVDPGGAIWDADRAASASSARSSIPPPRSRPRASSAMSRATASRSASPPARRANGSTLLAELLVPAGLAGAGAPDIRNEIWVKLWGNLSFNPISALTGGTLAGDRCRRRHPRARPRHDARGAGDRRKPRRAVSDRGRPRASTAPASGGEHKTSMLQDLERGRPMEIDALVSGGAGTWPANGQADADDRCRAGAGKAESEIGGVLTAGKE